MVGSAPHMRGIRSSPMDGTTSTWISPAHAGNTKNNGWKGVGYKDQPRTCGEYSPGRGQFSCGGGSAPHMRGIPRGCRLLWRPVRISPAHAGNTLRALSPIGWPQDQPRTCGEYLIGYPAPGNPRGSAPHMRGIRSQPDWGSRKSGISPAHAGNTTAASPPGSTAKDQPRTCGEYWVRCFWGV